MHEGRQHQQPTLAMFVGISKQQIFYLRRGKKISPFNGRSAWPRTSGSRGSSCLMTNSVAMIRSARLLSVPLLLRPTTSASDHGPNGADSADPGHPFRPIVITASGDHITLFTLSEESAVNSMTWCRRTITDGCTGLIFPWCLSNF
jgi:hypothetical protein